MDREPYLYRTKRPRLQIEIARLLAGSTYGSEAKTLAAILKRSQQSVSNALAKMEQAGRVVVVENERRRFGAPVKRYRLPG